jgi:hypothetical protein
MNLNWNGKVHIRSKILDQNNIRNVRYTIPRSWLAAVTASMMAFGLLMNS